jgi:hypothetical protein
MNVLRTPDERFAALAGYPFAPPLSAGRLGARLIAPVNDGLPPGGGGPSVGRLTVKEDGLCTGFGRASHDPGYGRFATREDCARFELTAGVHA